MINMREKEQSKKVDAQKARKEAINMRVKEKNLENKKDRNIRREIKERSKIFKSEFNEERLNELKENAHLIK